MDLQIKVRVNIFLFFKKLIKFHFVLKDFFDRVVKSNNSPNACLGKIISINLLS